MTNLSEQGEKGGKMMDRPIVICDIDGVIADLSHRLHFISNGEKKWDEFFAACLGDAPIPHAIRFIQNLSGPMEIVYVTGRPERSREATLKWFDTYHVPFVDSHTLLLMRADGDHREDHVIKKELYRRWINQTRVIGVIEDRDQVVEMWRGEGLLCLQPKKGDY